MLEKIFCLTFDYPPAKGGVARYLSSLQKESQEVIKVVVPIDFQTKDNNVVKSSFWWSGWPKWLPLVKTIWNIDDKNKILVSHVFPIGTAVWLVSFFKKKQYILLFHGTDLKRVKSKWKKFLLNQITNRSEALLVNSLMTQKLLNRLIKRKDSFVLTPGLEGFELGDKSNVKIQLNQQNKQIVLSVARLVPRKGIDILITAFSKISRENKNLQLVIVGNGPELLKLQKLASLLNLNVLWLNDLSDKDLYLWYSAADVFVLPGYETSDDIEGFGMVFLEASYAGLPIIAGDTGGTREAVIHNETGVLINSNIEELSRALREILNNKELRETLGQKGRKRVLNDFNWIDRWRYLRFILNDDLDTDFLNAKQKEVGVVIPCYNHTLELNNTLKSLSEQKLKPKKVVVVDDGSVNSPIEVINKYTKILNIEFIQLDKNYGAPKARNEGRKYLNTEFVLFLDADASLKPRALLDMVLMLYFNPQADFVYTDFYWDKRLFKGMPFSFDRLKKINYINTVSLIRMNSNPVFDENLKKFQDWDLWLTLAERGKKGVYLPRALFTIKQRKTGISQWLPAVAYKIPWRIFGWTPKLVLKYNQAKKIIYKKHNYE